MRRVFVFSVLSFCLAFYGCSGSGPGDLNSGGDVGVGVPGPAPAPVPAPVAPEGGGAPPTGGGNVTPTENPSTTVSLDPNRHCVGCSEEAKQKAETQSYQQVDDSWVEEMRPADNPDSDLPRMDPNQSSVPRVVEGTDQPLELPRQPDFKKIKKKNPLSQTDHRDIPY